MIDYTKFKPVRPLTFVGTVLLKILRFLYACRKLLGFEQWETPLSTHHEDPLKMNFKEKLYLGYKYYYKAIVQPEPTHDLAAYFARQTLIPTVPADFIVDSNITMSAGGDLIPYKCIQPRHSRHLWEEAGPFFFQNDIVFANLETVADVSQAYSAAPEIMLHDMYFNIQAESFSVFSGNHQYKGYDVLSTANNHTMDMGENGILATQEFLRSRNIAYCGTSRSPEERDDFPIVERNGIKTAFLAYTFSLNKESLPAGKEWLCNHILLNEPNPDISLIVYQAKLASARGADMVVASLHMGCAYQAYPSMHTVKNIHRICREADIDIVLGGHPHNLQPMEIYTSIQPGATFPKEHFIVYSLADFIAYDIYKWCHLPMLLQFQISKGSLNGKPHTQLTGVKAKAFYMHLDDKGETRLLEFQRIAADPGLHFKDKAIINEVKELDDFFRRFIITKNQEHILAD